MRPPVKSTIRARGVGDHPAEDAFDPYSPRSGRVSFGKDSGEVGLAPNVPIDLTPYVVKPKLRLPKPAPIPPGTGLRIYLAGPMTGIKEFNFPAFHAAAKMLRRHGHEVFNPAEQDMIRHGGIDISIGMSGDPKELAALHGFSLREALRDDTQYICMNANAIAMLPGWENSKGARAEHQLAFALGHQILYLGSFYG